MKITGIFWIVIGIVFVPPFSVLWLTPLGLYTHPTEALYLITSTVIGILLILKGTLQIRKEKNFLKKI